MDNSATESEAQAKRRARTPLPGQRVRGSRTGRPIMAALDLLGRRWTLRVLWELRQEALTFRALRSRCNSMSPSVLNARLSELREAGLLATRLGEGYQLTEQGLGLLRALAPLDNWAKGWSRIAARPARIRVGRPGLASGVLNQRASSAAPSTVSATSTLPRIALE